MPYFLVESLDHDHGGHPARIRPTPRIGPAEGIAADQSRGHPATSGDCGTATRAPSLCARGAARRRDEYQPPLPRWGHAWRVLVHAGRQSPWPGSRCWQREADARPVVVADLGLGAAAYVAGVLPPALAGGRRRGARPGGRGVRRRRRPGRAGRGLDRDPAPLAADHAGGARRTSVAGLSCHQRASTADQDPSWVEPYRRTRSSTGGGARLGHVHRLAARADLDAAATAPSGPRPSRSCACAQARSNERARIAREMHDVLAHRISQISMHAGALAFREDLVAEEMRASAAVIREKAHEALTDLRGVLGVLRDACTGELLRRAAADVRRPAGPGRRGPGLGPGRMEFDDHLDDDGDADAGGRRAHRLPDRPGGHHQRPQARARQPLLTVRVSGSPDEGVDVVLRNPLGLRPTATPGAGPRAGRPDRAGRAARRPARAPAATGRRSCSTGGYRGRHDDSGAARRRRPAGPLGAGADARAARRTSRSSARPVTAARGVAARARGSTPTWCSWTSGCRGWTASTRPASCTPSRSPPRVIVLTTFDADDHVVGALACRRRRVPAQGHAAAADRRGDPQGRRRRADALAVGDPDADPAAARPPERLRRAAPDAPPRRRSAGPAHRPRARRRARGRPRAEQRRDRRRAVPVGAHGQGARLPVVREARRHQPGPDRDLRPRRGPE